MARPMNVFSANPVGFIVMGLLLLGVGLYYAWGAIDHLGLGSALLPATVTGKQINPPHDTYRTNIVAGRAYTQSDTLPETRVVTLKIGDEAGVGFVTAAQYAQLQPGDSVDVLVQRTRLTRRLQVLEVRPRR